MNHRKNGLRHLRLAIGGAGLCATALFTQTAHAERYFSSTEYSKNSSERRGPFGFETSSESGSTLREYVAPGGRGYPYALHVTVDSSRTVNTGDEIDSSTSSTNNHSANTTLREAIFTDGEMAVGGTGSPAAEVTADGRLRASRNAFNNPFSAESGGEGTSDFTSRASAGWTDTWAVGSASHSAGTAGQLRVTLNLSGALDMDFLDPDAPPPAADQLPSLVATFGSQTFTLRPDWRLGAQSMMLPVNVDFVYGAAFGVSLTLKSAPGLLGSGLSSSDDFSGWLSTVLIPKDAELSALVGAGGAAPIPEPGQWLMMLAGLGLVAGAARRRQHSPTAAV